MDFASGGTAPDGVGSRRSAVSVEYPATVHRRSCVCYKRRLRYREAPLVIGHRAFVSRNTRWKDERDRVSIEWRFSRFSRMILGGCCSGWIRDRIILASSVCREPRLHHGGSSTRHRRAKSAGRGGLSAYRKSHGNVHGGGVRGY